MLNQSDNRAEVTDLPLCRSERSCFSLQVQWRRRNYLVTLSRRSLCVESQSSETVIRSPRYGLISGCFACFFWKPEVNWRFLGKEIPRENERPLSCCSAANDCDMTNRTEHLRSVFLPPFFFLVLEVWSGGWKSPYVTTGETPRFITMTTTNNRWVSRERTNNR